MRAVARRATRGALAAVSLVITVVRVSLDDAGYRQRVDDQMAEPRELDGYQEDERAQRCDSRTLQERDPPRCGVRTHRQRIG